MASMECTTNLQTVLRPRAQTSNYVKRPEINMIYLLHSLLSLKKKKLVVELHCVCLLNVLGCNLSLSLVWKQQPIYLGPLVRKEGPGINCLRQRHQHEDYCSMSLLSVVWEVGGKYLKGVLRCWLPLWSLEQDGGLYRHCHVYKMGSSTGSKSATPGLHVHMKFCVDT